MPSNHPIHKPTLASVRNRPHAQSAAMPLEAGQEAFMLAAARCSFPSLLVLLLAPLPAPATEGLTFLNAYLSDAINVTEAMVKACTSWHPDLTARGAAAFDSWRRRNAADARRAAEFAAQEMRSLQMSKEETERALAQLKQEHLEGWQRVAAFPTACSDYVGSLERPESDLARFLPRPKGAAADELRPDRLPGAN